MIQLDHDGDVGPMRGLSVALEVKNEVQRKHKRAELAPFLYLVKSICVPTTVHVDNKGIIDGL